MTFPDLRINRIQKIVFVFLLLIIPSIAFAGGNTTNDSFSRAKRLLLNEVYYDHLETFYCGCPFRSDKSIIRSKIL